MYKKLCLISLVLLIGLSLTAQANLLNNPGLSGAGEPADWWASSGAADIETGAARVDSRDMATCLWREPATNEIYQDIFVTGNIPPTYTIWTKFDDTCLNLNPNPNPPANLMATGHDSRIDLRWKFDCSKDGYNIYRADSPDGPFTRLNPSLHTVSVYSDFLGVNDQTYYYFVTSVVGGKESDPSGIVSATSFAMTDSELLTSVQEATFRYFWDYAHPVSGLAREGYGFGHGPDVCASGGTGMGLMAIIVGVERGFVTRAEAAERVLKILTFLDEKAARYHGAWAHWIHGATGETIPFSEFDDGGDIVETSYLIQGMLTVRQYFDGLNPVETEIRRRATEMWEEVNWYWYLRRSDPGHEDNEILYWHWSPNHGWRMNLRIQGFHETKITYLLAIASPTHPIPASSYHSGWAGLDGFVSGETFYGYLLWVGIDYGGPLFFTHYSFLGFDPRNKSDGYANYFENSRNIALIHRQYSIDNPGGFTGYCALVWGLTAGFGPWGYAAHAPGWADTGTVVPSAALSSMPFTPAESMATLRHFYHTYGGKGLWGPFGFVDAFHLGENWFAPGYVAISQGPIVVMIENYRTQLLWNLFMANPEIQPMLDAIGWVRGKRNPDDPAGMVSGLDYEYYEGAWERLPDFDSLTPVARGTVANFDISPRRQNDFFAFRFTGYIEVPADGGYIFWTESDGGSRLYIGDTLVVDNDGLGRMREESGFIALKAGKHAIKVTYFEKDGGEGLIVSYAAQGIPRTQVPNNVLYRAPTPIGGNHYRYYGKEISPADIEYLEILARDTWRCIHYFVHPVTGIPFDSNARGDVTNTTNIGLYITSLVAAVEMGFIPREEALIQMRKILRRLQEYPHWQGLLNNWLSVGGKPIAKPGINVISDFNKLPAGLIVAAQAFPEIADECMEFVNRINWSILYDEENKRSYWGYDIVNQKLDGHGLWLAADTRLASFFKIASGKVPPETWLALGRREIEQYGYRFYEPGWNFGGLFLPAICGLFIDERILPIGKSTANFAYVQMIYARKKGFPVWGWSNCVLPACGSYTEGGFLKEEVVTPHASALAIIYYPRKVIANLRKLEEMGVREPLVTDGEKRDFGFRDSIDLTTGKVSEIYLTALDQAMLFISLANFLRDGVIWRYFAQDPMVDKGLQIMKSFEREDPSLLQIYEERDKKPILVEKEVIKPIRKRIIDNFDKPLSKNSIGGKVYIPRDIGEKGHQLELVEEIDRGGALSLTYNLKETKGGTIFVRQELLGMDLRAFNAITFDIKGDKEYGFTRNLRVQLFDRNDVYSVGYVTGIKDKWQRIILPLKEFWGILSDDSKVKSINFVLDKGQWFHLRYRITKPQGKLYIDNLSLETLSEEELQIPLP